MNRLTLNTDKCSCTSFYRIQEPIIYYSIGGSVLNRRYDVTDLGVKFNTNNKIEFSTHIDLTKSKAYSMLGFIIQACEDLDDIRSFKTIYCFLIRSILEHIASGWSPWYVYNLDTLDTVHCNRFSIFFFTGVQDMHIRGTNHLTGPVTRSHNLCNLFCLFYFCDIGYLQYFFLLYFTYYLQLFLS